MALNNTNSNQEAFINWLLKQSSEADEEYREVVFASCKFGTPKWKVAWNKKE